MDPLRSFKVLVDDQGFVIRATDMQDKELVVHEQSLEKSIVGSVICNDIPVIEPSPPASKSEVKAAAKPCCRWRRDEFGYLVCVPC
jgi:hypothetical protein